jgi:NADH-quinone oxidoreductase subunit M
MVNHGITTGGLFVLLGMLEERTNTNNIEAYGGLWGKIPLLSGFCCCFPLRQWGCRAEQLCRRILVIASVFRDYPWAAVAAFFGIVLVLAYMLRMVQKVIFEREKAPLALQDISLREGFVLSACAILIVFLRSIPCRCWISSKRRLNSLPTERGAAVTIADVGYSCLF